MYIWPTSNGSFIFINIHTLLRHLLAYCIHIYMYMYTYIVINEGLMSLKTLPIKILTCINIQVLANLCHCSSSSTSGKCYSAKNQTFHHSNLWPGCWRGEGRFQFGNTWYQSSQLSQSLTQSHQRKVPDRTRRGGRWAPHLPIIPTWALRRSHIRHGWYTHLDVQADGEKLGSRGATV